MRRAVSVLILSTAVALPARAAAAQDGPRLEWNEEAWGRVDTAEIAATSFLAVLGVGTQLYFVPTVGQQAGGVLLDDPARDALHLRTRPGRAAAARASDVLVHTNLLWPVLVDTLVVSWAVDGSRDVADQLFWMNAMSLVTTLTALTLTKNAVARERPFHDECLRDVEYDPSCDQPDRYRSFFSGHSAYAFTGASLVCVHHAHLPIYGGGFADTAACLGAMTIAVATAVLRIVADKHYLSDVAVGAAVGVLSGFGLPTLLHYGF